MMDNMMQNPDILSSMFDSNPQMRQIMENNPQIRQVLQDPETLQQAMRAATNPEVNSSGFPLHERIFLQEIKCMFLDLGNSRK